MDRLRNVFLIGVSPYRRCFLSASRDPGKRPRVFACLKALAMHSYKRGRANWRSEGMRGERELGDRTAPEQMLLDDSLDVFRRCMPVPGAFRVHEHDRTFTTDAQAVDFCP